MLRIAASIAGGVLVDLRETVTGLDEGNAVLVSRAVCHAAGCGRRSGGSGLVTGTLPRMVTITRPRHPLEGRPLRMLGSYAGMAGWSCCWCCLMAASR